MAAGLERKIADLQIEAESLQQQIYRKKSLLADTTLIEYGRSLEPLPRNSVRLRRILKGHTARVCSVQWAGDGRRLASASHDGRLIIWDALSTEKQHAITLGAPWVMSCAIVPSGGMVAAGGLDNSVSIYNLPDGSDSDEVIASPSQTLSGHIGFISYLQFVGENEILSGSGDTTCVLWDIERSLHKTTFRGHSADVMALKTLGPSADTFVSVGCDATARLWDIRSGVCERIFLGHESDINTVDAFPGGGAFVTGADDGTCAFYDLRADRQLARLGDNGSPTVTSVSFSCSGRGLYAAYDDQNVLMWDLFRGKEAAMLAAHDERVASLAVSPDGRALATASWDSLIKIWA